MGIDRDVTQNVMILSQEERDKCQRIHKHIIEYLYSEFTLPQDTHMISIVLGVLSKSWETTTGADMVNFIMTERIRGKQEYVENGLFRMLMDAQKYKDSIAPKTG